ncbi:MAG: lipopolysaccharide transport periplasmic protein LptA [Gammaproteobacteria bacterium]|nr:lipopolysaccharide transport periplasmic protein LptA [Gammaproteobacteria bacterium]
MSSFKLKFALLLFTLLTHSISGHALSTDKNQPINVEADKLEIDESRHISTYQGNVKMEQGTLHIEADKIVFYFTNTNEILRLEIEGSPATLKQLNDKNEPIAGKARKIIYTENQLLLKLMGNAHFKSNTDSIDGEWININTNTETLQAGSTKGENRVRMIILPKNIPANDKTTNQ